MSKINFKKILLFLFLCVGFANLYAQFKEPIINLKAFVWADRRPISVEVILLEPM